MTIKEIERGFVIARSTEFEKTFRHTFAKRRKKILFSIKSYFVRFTPATA